MTLQFAGVGGMSQVREQRVDAVKLADGLPLRLNPERGWRASISSMSFIGARSMKARTTVRALRK
jgi:hypothetical protein